MRQHYVMLSLAQVAGQGSVKHGPTGIVCAVALGNAPAEDPRQFLLVAAHGLALRCQCGNSTDITSAVVIWSTSLRPSCGIA